MGVVASLLVAAAFPVSLVLDMPAAARIGTAALPVAELSAAANDNRTPAGTHAGDTLVLRLTVSPVVWHILGDSNPGIKVFAFAEEGKTPSIPGPLLRVQIGTPINVVIRNPLGDTLVLRGLGERGGVRDSLVVLPGTTGELNFVARRAGTYQYWSTLAASQRSLSAVSRVGGLVRRRLDSQLAGAFIVDAPGRIANDRVFVITEIANQTVFHRDRHGIPAREFTALNGRSWPYTERLRYMMGDTVRWRLINASFQPHPMHLHGFYFGVDSHGSEVAGVDSIYLQPERRMAVTEVVGPGESVSLTWSPDRPGGWIFHCHLTPHSSELPPVDQPTTFEYPISHDHGDPDQHVVNGMNGLILGITVAGHTATHASWHPAERLRLFVQSDSAPGDLLRRFGYVLQRGAEPRRDSIESPGPVLILTRGRPTSIEVVNRSTEPTSVHWHGIELESYYDGAVGWAGSSGHTSPAIRPESSFDVHITPKRAGTFMYHTHFNEMHQQYGGLVGALVVLEPGQRWNPARDLLFLVSDTENGSLVVNGSATPPPKELHVGTTYRIRLADIGAYRDNLMIRLLRDSSVASWRAVAKDGFTLPPKQATFRPSTARVASGETADFEFTPDSAGEMRLEIGTPSGALGGGAVQVQGAVRLLVVPR